MDKHPVQQFIVRTLIKHALFFEEQSATFYQQAANRLKTEPKKKLLLSLAEEELQHQVKLNQILAGNFHEIFEVTLPQEKLDLAIDSKKLHQPIDDTWSEPQILELAVMREKASYDFYYLLAQKTKIKTAKQVFRYLAQQEQSHIAKLETELKNTVG
ncbi:MAG: ferritin family protein [bacterium]|nr:ferritin family protein [bacterium]